MDELKKLIESLRANIATKLESRKAHTDAIQAVRSACGADGDRNPTDEEARSVTAAVDARKVIDDDVTALRSQLEEAERELAADEAAERLAREVHPVGAQRTHAPAQVVREERTYNPGNDRNGKQFAADVARAFLGDFNSNQRLQRHMQEERVERGDGFAERATGTGAFSGLVVPQYLTEMYAPAATSGRPFANICNTHDLPDEGMTVEIGRVTTSTSVDNQSAEGAAAAEQDMDDTMLSVPVRTAAGQQTVSRQALDRGRGVEDVTLQDLFNRYAENLDKKLIQTATVGLSAMAASNGVTYTDATPTAAELYPKLLNASSLVEEDLLNIAQPDFAVMHSRRWNWLQSQVGTAWPFFSQPGIPTQSGGVNNGAGYGQGVRGQLPNGLSVVVDNNIQTNLGAGTNEDEVYVIASRECHLWEDPNAPVFLRAEQPKAGNLQVLLVAYGYFAFTYGRYPGATSKISGTGLITPTF